jgi:hypothetical protein
MSIATYVADLLAQFYPEAKRTQRISESALVEEGRRIVALLLEQSKKTGFSGTYQHPPFSQIGVTDPGDGVFYAALHPLYRIQAKL